MALGRGTELYPNAVRYWGEPAGMAAERQGRADWWRGAVLYQVYPLSFCDSNGDGEGDLPGLASKLEHIASLGVDGIWISPFFPSPMKDFGYDVSDYCGVDPRFGTLADFDRVGARQSRGGPGRELARDARRAAARSRFRGRARRVCDRKCIWPGWRAVASLQRAADRRRSQSFSAAQPVLRPE